MTNLPDDVMSAGQLIDALQGAIISPGVEDISIKLEIINRRDAQLLSARQTYVDLNIEYISNAIFKVFDDADYALKAHNPVFLKAASAALECIADIKRAQQRSYLNQQRQSDDN